MARLRILCVVTAGLAACSGDHAAPVGVDPDEVGPGEGGKADGANAWLPDVRCSEDPATGPSEPWQRPFHSPLIALGSPVHRGIDLVASADQAVQIVRGEISYGVADKALDDEWVDVYACRAGIWRYLDRTMTDDEGRFELALTGADRLPIGIRDLLVSVAGDRTSTRFVALVAPAAGNLAVSDIDGTLTSSETAFATAVITGSDVAPHPDAPQALHAIRAAGYAPVYLTARGRYFTSHTRTWLEQHGFPRGALRLASGIGSLPGDSTIEHKITAMLEIAASDLVIAIGIGNRASDQAAYQTLAVPGELTFLKQQEYADEVAPLVDAGDAIGFDDYAELVARFQ
ncbi:MAG: hypothetical protein AB7P03_24475 [Kofleriaceae bacterium]